MVHDPVWDLVREPRVVGADRARTALLILDMQVLGAAPEGWLGRLAREQGRPGHLDARFAAVAAMLPSLQHVLARCRDSGVEPIHVRTAFRTGAGRDGLRDFLRGQPRAEDFDAVAAARPQGDEIVIDKTSVSPFSSTAIDQVLRNLRRDRLWVCGIATDGAVELTARDAADRGYAVTLVTDACAASSRAAHDDAIQRLTDGAAIQGRTAAELLAEI